MHDLQFPFATRQVTVDAAKNLALLDDNANMGRDIGIDEYENTPTVNVDQ